MNSTSEAGSIFLSLKQKLKIAIRSFSKRQYKIFWIFGALMILSTIIMLSQINNRFLVGVPANGGKISEGILGSPRFVNPILAVSDADRDVTTLVYSGLMKKDESGEMVPDLAEDYEISDDGLIYTFKIKKEAKFHDGVFVTADDVVFTINQAVDPIIKSPKRVNWEGVLVKKIDDYTVEFVLKNPFSPFIENMSIGILPAHIWKNVRAEDFSYSDFNIEGIGSGPYKISSIDRKSSGIPGTYVLVPFKGYVGGKPHIKKLTLKFYSNEKDLISGLRNDSVDQINGITPSIAGELKKEGYNISTSVLPRIFGLFFNQNESPIFADKNVIKAFDVAIDKKGIVNEVLSGYGTSIDGPIPENFLTGIENVPNTFDTEKAKEILDKAGWKAGADGILLKSFEKGKPARRLSFSISTGDSSELRSAVELIKKNLTAIGAEVDIKIFEIGTLNQNVIRARKYDAIFFGQIVNHESDLFAFWHSSQRNDPGLNIALYANPKTDKLLESALATLDENDRDQKFMEFGAELKNDLPAVFVYSPDFIYVTKENLAGNSEDMISIPSDRFNGVEKWYVQKEYVWKFFAPKQLD